MTTSNINRRTALLGTAAALAPATAMANSSMSTGSVGIEPDPAVLAFHEWIAAHTALKVAGYPDENTPEGPALWQRLDASEDAMAEVVPTTPEGLTCKVRYACELMADPAVGGGLGEPEDYQHWSRPNAPDFIDSLLAHAERLAGRAV